jgi:uncharacterized protein YegL
MTKPNFCEIVIILDRSGSMVSVRNDTIGGFNTFVEEQKKTTVGECLLTLVQFDNEYEVVYSGKPITEVPLLNKGNYIPRGSTALLDAIGKTINEVGARLSKMNEEDRPSLVIFVTQTDGQENASLYFRSEQIKEMIKHQTYFYNWQFVFLGADQDSFQAEEIGISRSNTYNYLSTDSYKMHRNLSSALKMSRIKLSEIDPCEASSVAVNIGDMMREEDKK